METQSFVELLNKFNSDNKNVTQNSNSAFTPFYPYGEFPTNKTKKGQQQKINALNNPEPTTHNNTPPHNNVENNSEGGFFNGMDFKLLLPLLMNSKNKKSFSTFDLFNLLMPTISKSNPNLKEFIKFFSSTQNQNESKEKKELPPSSIQSIDSFTKI